MIGDVKACGEVSGSDIEKRVVRFELEDFREARMD
jgi:hypothetical protein